MKAFLVLENGDIYEGESFGANTNLIGEIVFNTSMAGYQEILTDPSYKQQIITMTYPMIGNYGVHPDNMESNKIQANGIIVKEYVPRPSNFKSTESLAEFLRKENIPGISGIDTRKLTRFIRTNGAPNGGIFVAEKYSDDFLQKIKEFKGIKGSDLVGEVTTQAKYDIGQHSKNKFKLAVYDYGVKNNILNLLDQSGFAVTVFPAKTPIEDLYRENFDAYFLSNGPGDPEPLDYAIKTVKSIIENKKPLFGICLGHQITALATGKKTYKMKFGHRGGNQPVKNQASGKVEITSQNHGFAVEEYSTVDGSISHINLNDKTIEGMKFAEIPVMTVQYHPESSPGPHDSEYLFKEFFNMVKRSKESIQ